MFIIHVMILELLYLQIQQSPLMRYALRWLLNENEIILKFGTYTSKYFHYVENFCSECVLKDLR